MMATQTATISVNARLAEVYNTTPKTRQKKALSAMRQVLQPSVRDGRKQPHLSKRETALFLRINQHLSSEQQDRYDELRMKREDETLTPEEFTELERLIEEVITIWNDRLQALVTLARLRRISPQKLMQQLTIGPQAYET